MAKLKSAQFVAVSVGLIIRSADRKFQMMYLALTYDHRLLDGREAVVFLVKVKIILFLIYIFCLHFELDQGIY